MAKITVASGGFPAYLSARPHLIIMQIITESIHGHEVMHLIADAKLALTKDAWITEIGRKFGATAKFHTCSAENLSAAALMDFLIARGKFDIAGPALSLDATKICQH